MKGLLFSDTANNSSLTDREAHPPLLDRELVPMYFIIIDDMPKLIVNQANYLLKTGVKSDSIKAFWLNTDHIEGESQISNAFLSGNLCRFHSVKEVIKELIDFVGEQHQMHILLDMEMGTTDKDLSGHAGSNILRLIIQDPSLQQAMLDKTLGVTITSSNDVDQVFEDKHKIELKDGRSFIVNVDANAKRIKLTGDQGQEIDIYKAREAKFGQQCVQIIRIIEKDDGKIGSHPNMAPLFYFLQNLCINYSRANSSISNLSSSPSESSPDLITRKVITTDVSGAAIVQLSPRQENQK